MPPLGDTRLGDRVCHKEAVSEAATHPPTPRFERPHAYTHVYYRAHAARSASRRSELGHHLPTEGEWAASTTCGLGRAGPRTRTHLRTSMHMMVSVVGIYTILQL